MFCELWLTFSGQSWKYFHKRLSGLATVVKIPNGIIWTAILSSKKIPAFFAKKEENSCFDGQHRIIQVRLNDICPLDLQTRIRICAPEAAERNSNCGDAKIDDSCSEDNCKHCSLL